MATGIIETSLWISPLFHRSTYRKESRNENRLENRFSATPLPPRVFHWPSGGLNQQGYARFEPPVPFQVAEPDGRPPGKQLDMGITKQAARISANWKNPVKYVGQYRENH